LEILSFEFHLIQEVAMTLQIAGQTAHFTVRWDDSVGAPAKTVADAVLGLCEVDLARLTVSMPSHSGGGGDPFVHPPVDIQIFNDLVNGPGFGAGDNNGHIPGNQSRIRINPFSAAGVTITTDYAGFVFVAEMSELIMGFYGWDAGSSQGEALSRVMAEELHPASTSNWVNVWLSAPRPRPDWISRDAAANGGIFGRGDLNQMAYGCGMIFIYFLRYQLNFPYNQIVGAGGTLLSDRYRHLTGAADDPAARVAALLDAHFGIGSINLVSNNPFPLYDGAARKVLLAFGKPAAHVFLLPESGHAHIKPFFNCSAADYPYSEVGRNVTQTVTATTLGIGFPKFQWWVNGEQLFGLNGSRTVTAAVDVPDPQHPKQPQHKTANFTFSYTISKVVTAAGGSSTLTLTSGSLDGAFGIELQADADEQAVPTGWVSAKAGLTFDTRWVIYGGSYSEDRDRCVAAFKKATAHWVRIKEPFNLLLTLPDPPEPGYLSRVLKAVAQIQYELSRLAETDHPAAAQIARFAGEQLGVPAHVFLKGAQSGGESASAAQ
jgi:hypothetical protein